MDKRDIIIILMVLAFIFLAIHAGHKAEKIERLEAIIAKQDTILRLQAEHFNQCSFIHQDSVKIGYGDYLYVTPSK